MFSEKMFLSFIEVSIYKKLYMFNAYFGMSFDVGIHPWHYKDSLTHRATKRIPHLQKFPCVLL